MMGRVVNGDGSAHLAARAAADAATVTRALLVLTCPADAPPTTGGLGDDRESLASLTHRLGLNPSFRASTNTHDGAADAASSVELTFGGTLMRLYHAPLAAGMCRQAGLPPDPADADGVAVVAIELCAPLPPAGSARALGVQRLCCVAAMLAGALGATRMAWLPARLWSATADLGEAIAAMEADALPPVLNLVGFTPAPHQRDGRAVVQSHGLAFFADCELQLDYPAAMLPADALRRLTRLAIYLMLNGAPARFLVMRGLVAGEQLRINVRSPPQAPGAAAAVPLLAVMLEND